MTRIIVIAVLVVSVVGIGTGLWVISSGKSSIEARREFFSAPQDYDTSGGQQMQPRWGDQEGAGDGAADK